MDQTLAVDDYSVAKCVRERVYAKGKEAENGHCDITFLERMNDTEELLEYLRWQKCTVHIQEAEQLKAAQFNGPAALELHEAGGWQKTKHLCSMGLWVQMGTIIAEIMSGKRCEWTIPP